MNKQLIIDQAKKELEEMIEQGIALNKFRIFFTSKIASAYDKGREDAYSIGRKEALRDIRKWTKGRDITKDTLRQYLNILTENTE